MKTRLTTKDGVSRTRQRWTLTWLFLTLLSLTSWAGGGSGDGNTPPEANSLTPESEGVTSLPIVQDSSGLTFVGTPRELRALGISLQGSGRIEIQLVGRNTFAVTLVGDYQVVLDRAALARSTVPVLWRGGASFHGGVALLEIGASGPVALAPNRVPLPLARMAQWPRAQGDLLTLEVYGLNAKFAHVAGHFAPDRVILTQRSN